MKRFIASFLTLVLMISYALPVGSEENVSSPNKDDVGPKVIYRQTFEQFIESRTNTNPTDYGTTTYYNDDGTVRLINDGYRQIYYVYYEDGTVSSTTEYNENGSIDTSYDEDGNVSAKTDVKNEQYDPVNNKLYYYVDIAYYNPDGTAYRTEHRLYI